MNYYCVSFGGGLRIELSEELYVFQSLVYEEDWETQYPTFSI